MPDKNKTELIEALDKISAESGCSLLRSAFHIVRLGDVIDKQAEQIAALKAEQSNG